MHKYIILTLGGKSSRFEIDETLDSRLRKTLQGDYQFNTNNELILEKDSIEKTYQLKQKVFKKVLERIGEYDIPEHLKSSLDDLIKEANSKKTTVYSSDIPDMENLLQKAVDFYDTARSSFVTKEEGERQREQSKELVDKVEKFHEDSEDFASTTSDKIDEFKNVLEEVASDETLGKEIPVDKIENALSRVEICSSIEEYQEKVGNSGNYSVTEAVSSGNDKIVLPPETKLDVVAAEIIKASCPNEAVFQKVISCVENKKNFNDKASKVLDDFRSDLKTHSFDAKNLNYYGDRLINELERICSETGISFDTLLHDYFSPSSSVRNNSVLNRFMLQVLKYNHGNEQTRALLEALIIKKAVHRHLVSSSYTKYLKADYRNINIDGQGYISFQEEQLMDSTDGYAEGENVSLETSSDIGINDYDQTDLNLKESSLDSGGDFSSASSLDTNMNINVNMQNPSIQKANLKSKMNIPKLSNLNTPPMQNLNVPKVNPKIGSMKLNGPTPFLKPNGMRAQRKLGQSYNPFNLALLNAKRNLKAGIDFSNLFGRFRKGFFSGMPFGMMNHHIEEEEAVSEDSVDNEVSDGSSSSDTSSASESQAPTGTSGENGLEETGENEENPQGAPLHMADGGNTVGAADKKALKKLKKWQVIAIGGVIGALLLIAVLLVIFSEELKPKYDYIKPNCEQITVHFENRDDSDITLDLEDYVLSMTYSLTKDLSKPKRVFYQAIAVAVRTNAQKLNQCTLNVSDEVDALYNFEVLDESNNKYLEVLHGTEQVENLVMAINNRYVDVTFDNFCYKTNDGTNYTLVNSYSGPELPTSWFSNNILNGHYKSCPCEKKTKRSKNKENECWVLEKYNDEKDNNDKRIPYYRYVDGGTGEGLSIYAAHYLSSVLGYHDEDILRFFYPMKWKYYTLKEEDANDEEENNTIAGLSEKCYFWPIGGSETKEEGGKLFAKGTPVSTRITSSFGNRKQPTAGASTNHQAIDIGGPSAGTPEGTIYIIAAANGEVTDINAGCVSHQTCNSSLGNYVKITHADGTITRYGHLYSVSVAKGEQVKQGQVIGMMGSTGVSTATHLDFQVVANGNKVDPLNYVSATNTRPNNCGVSNLPIISGIVNGYTGNSKTEFINFIAPYAIQSMHSSNILASVIIAQAALESGWGSSELASKYHNYFGVKANDSWTGEKVLLPTTECTPTCHKTKAYFRVYENPLQSIEDHAKVLSHKRYNGVIGEKDYNVAIQIIKNGGYATDPDYVTKIINTINSNDMAKYDKG